MHVQPGQQTPPPKSPPKTGADARQCHPRPEPSSEALLEEKHRHVAHEVHTGVDLARLAKEAPEIAEKLAHVIARSPRLEAATVEAIAELGQKAPTLTHKLLDTMLQHPAVGKQIAKAAPRVAKLYAEVVAKLAKEFPRLSPKLLARIAENSVMRGIGKAIPVLGVGIALWGSYDTAKAFLDPKTSDKTRALYASANAADWGAALGGIFAATGVGEAAAIAAAVGSIYLYAKAEASKELDHQAAGQH